MEKDSLILSQKESFEFLSTIMKPDKNVVRKREEFFKSVDNLQVIETEDEATVIELPDTKEMNMNNISIKIEYCQEKIVIVQEGEGYYPLTRNNDRYYEAVSSGVA